MYSPCRLVNVDKRQERYWKSISEQIEFAADQQTTIQGCRFSNSLFYISRSDRTNYDKDKFKKTQRPRCFGLKVNVLKIYEKSVNVKRNWRRGSGVRNAAAWYPAALREPENHWNPCADNIGCGWCWISCLPSILRNTVIFVPWEILGVKDVVEPDPSRRVVVCNLPWISWPILTIYIPKVHQCINLHYLLK